MKYQLHITPSAKRNAQQILRYLEKRSRRGARAWYSAFQQMTVAVEASPASFPLAPENDRHEEEIRNAIFKTRKGLPYRALFLLRENQVYIVHVRGPGQNELDADEIQNP